MHVTWALTVLAAADESEVQKVNYTVPDGTGIHFVDTMDTKESWVVASGEKFTGVWTFAHRQVEAIVSDVGLVVNDSAKHHAIAREIPTWTFGSTDFVIQYEAQFQQDLHCGGAYMKLLNWDRSRPLNEFDNEAPYVLMFGPDRCGGTNKVHFIVRYQNPVSKEWEEKHSAKAVAPPVDRQTHLYSLVVRTDNTFEVFVDLKSVATGSLLEDMSPSINPSAEIDDPTDSKPEDWIDNPKMPDPSATKPEDWDEDEPPQIDSAMPEGWREDIPAQIPDPAATIPEAWDEEEDGEWEPPQIPNPACGVGCGPYKPKKIPNPNFKGKWEAPQVDNPDYKGEWIPRQIANPHYFTEDNPVSKFDSINAIGFELWTMQASLLFDNILIADSWEKAQKFAESTWKIRSEIEDSLKPKRKSKTTLERLTDMASENLLWVVFAVVALVAVCWFSCRSPEPEMPAKKPSPKPSPARTEKVAPSASSGADATTEGIRKRENTKETGGLGMDIDE
mmetsp:Transcript_24410/g.59231  ORF Transcript_24410/g.59231 Transcript_24410/m.59231 type:complete len:504 (+) Transcript_24410:73-1584(+)